MSTATSKQITQVRARLTDTRALCVATNLQGRNSSWYQVGDWCLSGAGSDGDAVFMAAANPALMLRLVDHAEDVLDRHGDHDGARYCRCDYALPCPEVDAVIKAWTP